MNLFKSFLLLLCSTCLIGCNSYLLNEKDEEKEDPEEWYDYIPDGGHFLRGNTLRFYFIDRNGNSLIDPDDPYTLPVSWWEELTNPMEHTWDFDRTQGLYNSNLNGIVYDNELGMYYCSITAYGDERLSTMSFPLYVHGDIDRMDITYKYTNVGIIGGSPYYGKIVSWQYNGIHIYSDDEDEYDKKIFIRKADGKTTISFYFYR